MKESGEKQAFTHRASLTATAGTDLCIRGTQPYSFRPQFNPRAGMLLYQNTAEEPEGLWKELSELFRRQRQRFYCQKSGKISQNKHRFSVVRTEGLTTGRKTGWMSWVDRSVAKVVVELLAAPKCSRGWTVAQSNEFGRIKEMECHLKKQNKQKRHQNRKSLRLSKKADDTDTVCAEWRHCLCWVWRETLTEAAGLSLGLTSLSLRYKIDDEHILCLMWVIIIKMI